MVQFAKHSKNAPEITIDGKLYSVVQRVKVWMSHSNHGEGAVFVEVSSDWKSVVDSYVQTVSILLHNCRVLDRS